MVRPSHTRPVLLIDDSHEDLFLVKRLLARAGVNHPIVTIDSGEEAIVFLRATTLPGARDLKPLAIFCDVKMPAQTGFDVLKWIRTQTVLGDVPVHMLSGANLDSDRQQAMELGANGYLVKFPTPDVFKKTIEDAEASAAATGE